MYSLKHSEVKPLHSVICSQCVYGLALRRSDQCPKYTYDMRGIGIQKAESFSFF